MTDARRETVTPDDSRPCVSREQCLAVLASHRALADRLAASERERDDWKQSAQLPEV